MANENIDVPPGLELRQTGSESPCSYLPGRLSKMEYRLAYDLNPQRYRHLLERGWRRFGRTLFRPLCAQCSECRSIRVDVDAFRPSKSQRKIRNRNTDVTFNVVDVQVTPEHLSLYDAYHQDMHQRRGWPFRPMSQAGYSDSFLDGEFVFSREFQYRISGQLVAVGLVDHCLDVMSSLYFYHDPALRSLGLGVFSVLCELQYAAEHGVRWLNLGYYIRDCESMNYKNRYRPHQILQSYCELDEQCVWTQPE